MVSVKHTTSLQLCTSYIQAQTGSKLHIADKNEMYFDANVLTP